MNYFELFEIPVQLRVEANSLPRKYFELSRKYHPDYFVQASPQEQQEALERSAMLNKAFQTFQQPDDTIAYVLSLKGLMETGEKYALNPAFLTSVMELNEQLMELEIDPDAGALQEQEEQLNALYQKIYSDVASIVEHYQEGLTTEKELLQVKEYYYQKKYLDRIREKLAALKNELA